MRNPYVRQFRGEFQLLALDSFEYCRPQLCVGDDALDLLDILITEVFSNAVSGSSTEWQAQPSWPAAASC